MGLRREGGEKQAVGACQHGPCPAPPRCPARYSSPLAAVQSHLPLWAAPCSLFTAPLSFPSADGGFSNECISKSNSSLINISIYHPDAQIDGSLSFLPFHPPILFKKLNRLFIFSNCIYYGNQSCLPWLAAYSSVASVEAFSAWHCRFKPASISYSTLYKHHQVKGECVFYSKLPVFQVGKETHIQKCSFTPQSLK